MALELLRNRNYRAIFTHRLCNCMKAEGRVTWVLMLLARLAHRWTTWMASIDLPHETRIGYGFAITHGWGLVVSPKATIGSNVTLFHGVTIGRGDKIDRQGSRLTEYPRIGNDVWIGPHAVVAGGIEVGDGSRVLANAFVTFDVPSASMVSGNPASVVKMDCAPDVFNKVPPPL
jgi:serine O-acetyltransferase